MRRALLFSLFQIQLRWLGIVPRFCNQDTFALATIGRPADTRRIMSSYNWWAWWDLRRCVWIYWLHFSLNVLEPRKLWQKKPEEPLGTSLNAPAWWPLSQIHLADILHVWTPQRHLREHWDGGQFGIDSLQVLDWWSPFRLNRGVLNRTCALG